MNQLVQKLRAKLSNKKGFTLIEMIIVIAIIAILIALIAPNLTKFLNTAKQTQADAAAKTLYTSASTYIVEQYTLGETVTSGIWSYKAGTATGGPSTAEFWDDYFNKNEVSKDATLTVTVDAKGNVSKATYEHKAFTGKYPKEPVASTPTTGG